MGAPMPAKDTPEMIAACLRCKRRKCPGNCDVMVELGGMAPHPSVPSGHLPFQGRQGKPEPRPRVKREAMALTINGETLTIRGWAERYGISYQTLYHRLHRGMTLEEAAAKAVKDNGRRKRRGPDEPG